MPLYRTQRETVDRSDQLELVLTIPSFAAGENTVAPDIELKSNEARSIVNWDVDSLGGMIRCKGLTKVIDDGTYNNPIDLAVHHFAGTSTYSFYISAGNLLKKSSGAFSLDHASDAASFTSGVLSHAVSAGSSLWITNSTDNLHKKVVGAAVASATDQPTTASDRIYEHNFRLIAEGNTAKTVYGSMAGVGNWDDANAWGTSNDSWSIVMPDLTQGCVPGFPSGNDLTVFTKFDTFVVYNQPNVARRRVINGIGCHNAMTIARGNEGVYFLSSYPTLGIFLWDGNQYIDLTEKHDFQDDISLSYRMYGIYKDGRYWFVYTSKNSGVTYPTKVKIYDAKFGRWWTREISSSLSTALGYPCLLTKDSNELYFGSSKTGVGHVYELDDSTTADGGYDTEAAYTTKTFTSKDFGMSTDHVRLKLLKTVLLYSAPSETITVSWTSDHGKRTGSQSFDVTETGDLINATFIVNTSDIISGVETETKVKSFNNTAVGREFSFQILNSGILNRPTVKQLRITAIALEDL